MAFGMIASRISSFQRWILKCSRFVSSPASMCTTPKIINKCMTCACFICEFRPPTRIYNLQRYDNELPRQQHKRNTEIRLMYALAVNRRADLIVIRTWKIILPRRHASTTGGIIDSTCRLRWPPLDIQIRIKQIKFKKCNWFSREVYRIKDKCVVFDWNSI